MIGVSILCGNRHKNACCCCCCSCVLLLLLFNTTRAHTPDPQAQEPLSQWTEVWPTQPVRTQAVNRHKVGEEETPS